ncbi:MAG: hypothetical protein PGN13_07385 [Patulibacter minatonensis]
MFRRSDRLHVVAVLFAVFTVGAAVSLKQRGRPRSWIVLAGAILTGWSIAMALPRSEGPFAVVGFEPPSSAAPLDWRSTDYLIVGLLFALASVVIERRVSTRRSPSRESRNT